MSEKRFRAVLLEAIASYGRSEDGCFVQDPVLYEACAKLGIRHDKDAEQALLTVWSDLFRSGHLAWGCTIDNPAPPWVHLTEHGRATLEHLSRDPTNPDGYLNYLQSRASINPIAESYIREGLQTYNSNCFKATAVMIGAAAESVVLELRHALVTRMGEVGRDIPSKLRNWRMKTVLDAIQREFEPYTETMPRSLAEEFSFHWPAFTGQIRLARNEAGHPKSVDPVTPETVHAELLIFPELARLASELRMWMTSAYTGEG